MLEDLFYRGILAGKKADILLGTGHQEIGDGDLVGFVGFDRIAMDQPLDG